MSARQATATAVVAVLAATVTGCATGETANVATIFTQSPTATTIAATAPALETSAYDLTVTGAPIAHLTATTFDGGPPDIPGFLSVSGAGVTLALPGSAQPTAPVTVSFDFAGRSVPEVTDAVIPAVLTVAENSAQPEVLRSQWNSVTRTLTAETARLGEFFPLLVDVRYIGEQFDDAVKGLFRVGADKPDCVGKPAVIDGVRYRIEPAIIPAAWPCLKSGGDGLTIDLASRSPGGSIVRSDPPTGQMSIDLQAHLSTLVNQPAYGAIFAASVGSGTLLLPSGTTHLTFSRGGPPRQVGLRMDRGVTLLNAFSIGLNGLFPDSDVLGVPGVVACLQPLTPSIEEPDPTGAMVGTDTRSLIDCVTTTTGALFLPPKSGIPEPAGNIATRSLGAILSLGPSLANQLASTLGDLLRQAPGTNTETITITTA